MLNKINSKGSTKTLFYRDFKKFEKNKFARDLTHELQNIKNLSYSQIEKAFVTVLDNHAPLKKKQLRFNHSPFMTKALRKAIMTCSSLKNISNKKRSYENWDKFKKTKKFLRETPSQNKTGLLQQYCTKSVSDTKKFWKMIKPYFSNKGLNSNKIFLSEKGRLIKDPAAIDTTMNDYFVNINETIGLKQFQLDHLSNLFEDCTSIIRIKSNLDNVSDKLDFKKVHEEEVKREIMNLNSKKATCQGAIPAKILKQFCDSYLPIITKIIKESITEGTFPIELKLAEVTKV